MTWMVYILQSTITKKYYIGSTCNLSRRIKQHNSGHTRSTIHGIPWEVVYSELQDSRQSARARERLIKSYKGGNAFKKLLLQ